jgi:outer membrane protein OmpA-like peptidoglycan-associated protein
MGSRLRSASRYALLVEGHTDATGQAGDNLRLSLDRAESVRLALIASGIEPGRITSTGSGEAVPIGDNDTAAGRTANRRVEVVVLDF